MSVQLVHRWGGLGVYPGVVVTPDGPVPLASTTWSYTERWWTDRRTPGWAIVFGIAFGWTFVGLLFFMVSEQRPRGLVTIHMRSSVGAGWDQPVRADTVAQRAALGSEVLCLDAWCAAARQGATIPAR